MKKFTITVPMKPKGDQPKAIQQLVETEGSARTLLGVTGSGKTFTIANVIENVQKPTLVISPNKTLAAQLYEEFSRFFLNNKVCYFVSYYDHYQPESYLPANDVYIPKEAKINYEIDRLRTEALASLVSRKDVIVVSSVSCIYALGNPQDYISCAFTIQKLMRISIEKFMDTLEKLDFQRSNDYEKMLHGNFFQKNNLLYLSTSYQRGLIIIEFNKENIKNIFFSQNKNREAMAEEIDLFTIFPAKYFISTEEKREKAVTSIQQELQEWIPQLKNPYYQDRLYNRVMRDVEMIYGTGTCPGIENYSAHFDQRAKGVPPHTLFDFFELSDFMTVIDESHLSIPQMYGMHIGDKARKKSLIEYGFRLPSAYDNRPLTFEEAEKHFKDVIFVSATPGQYEQKKSDKVVEQIIRPTGIIDPKIKIYPRINQLQKVEELLRMVSIRGKRTLITVLTKKLAEDLALFLENKGIRCCYIHHKIKIQLRSQLLHKLRSGIFECLVGINLLREGLDLPEVALVIIMDADIQGFLRDKRSLIQMIGRAARNNDAEVALFADNTSASMRDAIEETNRRRSIQMIFNKKNGIVPLTAQREVKKTIGVLEKNYAETRI